jgi:uncharacterized protein involved in exopolysaccharide biosynthesis
MDDFQNQCRDDDKPTPAAENDEINILEYLKVIFKYRWMIVCFCVVAVVLTAIFSLRQAKVYSATTLIVPPVEILQKESELAGGFGGSSLLRRAIGVVNIADMYVGILKSRAVADAIIDRFDLMRVYTGIKIRSWVRNALRNNTIISVSGEGIVSITVKDGDPNRAAAMANAYVEELDQQNKRLSTGQATGKRVFLENRLKEIEGRLSKIDDILSREARMQEMLVELLTRECEIAKIEEAKSMPTIQVLDRATVPEMRDPRGTIRKSAVAGGTSFMFALLMAFVCEYLARMRRGAGRGQLQSSPEQDHFSDKPLDELESKRKIVEARRRKSSQGNQLYQRET